MKKEFDYITLIHKSLSNQLSEKERQLYASWLTESNEHQQLADELKSVWEATSPYMNQSIPNMGSSLARLKSSIQKEEKVEPKSKFRTLYKIAAIAALVAGLFFIWNQTLVDDSLQIVKTKIDEQTDVMLDDGTLAFVNHSSRLEKPAAFATDRREISLTGEAFFEVARDVNRPFVINTKNFEVEVLGTAFNLYVPKNKSLHEIVVDHGKVRIKIHETNETFILEKGDRLVYDNDTKVVSTSEDNDQNAQSWRTGQLSFNDTALKDVIFSVEKHFGIDLQCKNKAMLDCVVTIPTLENEKIDVVVETIQLMFNFDLKHRNGSRVYKFSAGSCN